MQYLSKGRNDGMARSTKPSILVKAQEMAWRRELDGKGGKEEAAGEPF